MSNFLTGWEQDQQALIIEIDDRPARIIQITDPHIFKAENGCLLGLETRKSLEAVIEDVQNHALKADLILATGDISQDQSVESYHYFSEVMNRIGVPVCWIPGNHDNVDKMAECFDAGNFSLAKNIIIGKWKIVLLDSCLTGKVHGRLGREQCVFLEKSIESQTESYCLTVLHHHPVDINCPWMETLGLEDSDVLFEILDRNTSVRGLIWGHIHQVYDQYRGKIRLMATPSTSVQFKPFSKEFAADSESPGYRILELHSDGRIDTQVRRVEHIEFTVDYSVKGY